MGETGGSGGGRGGKAWRLWCRSVIIPLANEDV